MRLPSYLHKLEKINHGTVTKIECDKEGKFKYLFFALGACIEGFQAMRKVIIVDGTHIKTVYGGVLIINQSIIKTIGEVYPKSQQGYCIWHLSQNVKLRDKGANREEVAKKFRECATVYTDAEFIPLYGAFRKSYPKAAEYLDTTCDLSKWAKCYFLGERYNIDTTNCCESMNNVFKDARKYSLLPMIDVIVAKIAEWFNNYRKKSGEGSSSQKVVCFVAGVLHKGCEVANLLPIRELNSFLLEYNVSGRDGKNHTVDLSRKTCTCKHFDIDRFPCEHAIAAGTMHAENSGKEFDSYELCSKYYIMEQWALAYYRTIFLVTHVSEWNVPDGIQTLCVLPPDYTIKQGRNQETRYTSVGEFGRRGVGRFFYSGAGTSI